jgi:outer membrane receptor protein involved in Fe transport
MAAALASISAMPAAAQEARPVVQLEKVDVIESTPLSGSRLKKSQLAAPVQSATSEDIDKSGALNLADFLNRNLGSIHVNETQGNPFQPDINYRGYSASPLLGTPQGVSVYMDGVRMNQPFGDVVSWDLIPKSAISTMTLMPGSNPLFGLNTLGGALNVQTKNGRSDPGADFQLSFGSFGRRSAEFDLGGFSNQGLDWYLSANAFAENGWRAASPSQVRQLFGKLGWRNDGTQVTLSAAHANNRLTGNGLQEMRLLQADYSSVYTTPDITQNKSDLLNLGLEHKLSSSASLSGNAYYRNIRTNTLNGDVNDGSLDQAVYGLSAADRAALTAAGIAFPSATISAANTPFPYLRCIAQALQLDEPGEKCNGLINRTTVNQKAYGVSGQLTLNGDLSGQRNQLQVGGSYDTSRVNFAQTTQLGYINPDRSITGINAFADGVTGGDVDGEPFDNRVTLRSSTDTWSVFASDTVTLGKDINITLSGRYNSVKVTNRDQINPPGAANSLDGDHTFTKLNPAFGVTWNPTRHLNTYLGIAQSSRAPTSIELGCANPEQPCKLPNAMAGDPPLNQVVTRTIEAGLRGDYGNGTRWNAGVFHAENTDDILFVADDQTGFGYFKNFGKTKREGVELGASTRIGEFTLGANYTYLRATYESAEVVGGSGNSTNDGGAGLEGNIEIAAGNRIPLIPQHQFKAYADLQVTPSWSVGANVVGVSDSIARGNENGQHQPDGTLYLGPGRSGGFAVLNLNSNVQLHKRIKAFVQINNVLDRKYYTAAQLGATAFNANGAFQARAFGGSSATGFLVQNSTFFAPGAPRSVTAGLSFAFDAN